MKLIVQRSKQSSVSVKQKTVGKINFGLVVLVGFTHTDTLNDIKYYVEVKATQSDKINFYLSPGEMKFMEENKETYILYMVTNVRDSKPNIKKFTYKDILKLKSKPTSARFSI